MTRLGDVVIAYSGDGVVFTRDRGDEVVIKAAFVGDAISTLQHFNDCNEARGMDLTGESDLLWPPLHDAWPNR